MTAVRLTLGMILLSYAAVYAADRTGTTAPSSPQPANPSVTAAAPETPRDQPTLPNFVTPGTLLPAPKHEAADEESGPVVTTPTPRPDAPQVTPATAPEPTTQPEPQPAPPRGPPAKKLFGSVKSPSPLAARAIGSYAKGCLSGAKPLAIDGANWQAMRLSRNRNWGHPDLIALIERFAGEVKQHDGWPGLLVGDLSQPRGGPMLTGHASHQIGLDADIWFTPMPDRRLSEKEREDLAATSMLVDDQLSVNSDIWTPAHRNIVKRAASYPEVERVLVHPAIKMVLCHTTPETEDRTWLSKVRPYWGHHYHFHVRMGCPKGSNECVAQKPTPGDDGCGQELVDWYKRIAPQPEPPKEPPAVPAKPAPPKPEVTLDQLPGECRVVLGAENQGEARLDSVISAPSDKTKKSGGKPKVASPAK